MKKHLFVLIFIFLYSIVSGQDNTLKVGTRESKQLDSIKNLALPFIYFGEVTEKNKSKIDSICFKEFAYYKTQSIQNLGETNIYKGYVSDGSNAGSGYYYFLLSEKGEKGIIFADDSIFFLKKEEKDTSMFIGSVANMRNGMIEIYDFVDNTYQPVFSSLDTTDYEFSTYTRKRNFNSCDTGIEYTVWSENGGLSFENIDINKDGFLDLKFSGKVKACLADSEESDRKIHEKYIEMIFLFNPISENSEWKRYVPDKENALPINVNIDGKFFRMSYSLDVE